MRFQLLTFQTLALAFYVSHDGHNHVRLYVRGNSYPSDKSPSLACRYFYRGSAKDAAKVFRLGLEPDARDGGVINSCGGPTSPSWLQHLNDAFEQGNEAGYVYVVDSEALIDNEGPSGGIPASAVTGAYIYERTKPQDEAPMMYNPNYHAKDHETAPSIRSLCSAEQQASSTSSIKNTGKMSKARLCDMTNHSKRSNSPIMLSGIRALAQSGLSAWAEGGKPPCQLPPDFKFKTKDGSSRLKNVPYISHLVGPKGNPQSELGLVILDVLNKRYDELDIEEACGELETEQAAESKKRAFAKAREMIEQALGKERAFSRAREIIEAMEKAKAERREFESR
ncbi:hypothetical protein CDD80_3303 [Ophiocordyceps camponoti-rufipedis]|uniref:Uncharacterized protein n=1 Tax=Ophiocordyceps camponoti-rufipedis TaxID=2004952 RepID=A0A2C5Z2P4_9HYPO|nr:hypothetical protein CDD80_3303 [Ophiocordyceps camponoti-rufipedis]